MVSKINILEYKALLHCYMYPCSHHAAKRQSAIASHTFLFIYNYTYHMLILLKRALVMFPKGRCSPGFLCLGTTEDDVPLNKTKNMSVEVHTYPVRRGTAPAAEPLCTGTETRRSGASGWPSGERLETRVTLRGQSSVAGQSPSQQLESRGHC